MRSSLRVALVCNPLTDEILRLAAGRHGREVGGGGWGRLFHGRLAESSCLLDVPVRVGL
jgi:hypothetical protein